MFLSVYYEKATLMKITFVTPAPSLDGGYRAVAIYADRLRQRGHEVYIVARAHSSPFISHNTTWRTDN